MTVAEPPDDDWVRRHYERIRRSAWLLCGNGDVADELAQETFTRAIDQWHRFEGRSEVSTWLYAILFRLHGRRRRAAARGAERLKKWVDLVRSRPNTSQDPAAKLASKVWRDSLWAEVSKLPSRQQEVVILRFAEGFTFQQIADTCGCPLGTAKTRLHHALRRLRKKHQVQLIQEMFLDSEDTPVEESYVGRSYQIRG